MTLVRIPHEPAADFAPFATADRVVASNAFDQRLASAPWLYELLQRVSPLWRRKLDRALPHLRGPRLLEVSFGNGYLMRRYAHARDLQVTGIDCNEPMIAATRRTLARAGLQATLVKGDAQHLPFPDESFDCLLNTDAFTLYPDSERAMREFHRVLRPGGRLVLMETNFPRDRNALGMALMALPRLAGMPLRDLDGLLCAAGFEYEDLDNGMAGLLHLYLATKPHGPPRLVASHAG